MRFSHEFGHASNKWAIFSLLISILSLPACAQSQDRPATIAGLEPGTATPLPAGPIRQTDTLLIFASATATSVPPSATEAPRVADSIAPTSSPTLASTTAAVSPSVAPSPTPFITAPPPGQSAAIPILMYHHLESLAPNASLTLRTWSVSPSNFDEQLDYLLAHGYHTISFVQLVGFFERGDPLPSRPAILTFDDGWSDGYKVAFESLRERGMTGTFFIPTAYAEAPGGKLMSWAEIKEMDAAGMEFGGHTINHADLRKLAREEALRQLTTSKSKMETTLNHATIAFSYPFGDYDADVVALVKEAGYRAAVGLCCGYKQRGESLLTLPRIRVSYDDTLTDFAKKLPPD